MVYTSDVNILGGSVHNVKENTEDLVVTAKVIGLEVNADKTKYLVMSQDQNVGKNHNITTDNSSFEKVEQFIYLGATLRIKILFRK